MKELTGFGFSCVCLLFHGHLAVTWLGCLRCVPVSFFLLIHPDLFIISCDHFTPLISTLSLTLQSCHALTLERRFISLFG